MWTKLWDVLQSGCVHVRKVWRVADLSLTGPLALPFAFFHRLDTPVLPHFISPHISFTPHISFKLITKTFTIQIAAGRSPHRPPHTSQSRSQIPLQTPSHLTDFSQILITDFSQIYLGFRAWAPGTPHHESFDNVFQLWCIIEAAGFCGWWPKIAILPSKLQIFSDGFLCVVKGICEKSVIYQVKSQF